jgi:hypothetical protein
MPDPNGHHTPYEVHASGAITAELIAIQQRASLIGLGDQVLSAIRQIHERLRSAPYDFGEPLYQLPALRMQIRCGIIAPLVIHFGVCEDRPLVFLKGVALISDPPA